MIASARGAIRPAELIERKRDGAELTAEEIRELVLAYVEGKNAAGRIHQGEFADVGATVNTWLGGKAPSRGIPGQPIVEH